MFQVTETRRRIISVCCAIFIVCLSCVGVFASSGELKSDSDLSEIPASEDVLISVKANPVTPSNTSGFHSVLLTILGDYEPVTVDYTYQNNNNQYYSHSITTDPDWSWIASAAIFALIIFCTFRLIGGLFSWKR